LAPSYAARLSLLPQDPNQLAAAHYVHKVVALMGLPSRVASMFSTLGQERDALARDLTGWKRIKAALARMAHR
jgi:hypothetical protein